MEPRHRRSNKWHRDNAETERVGDFPSTTFPTSSPEVGDDLIWRIWVLAALDRKRPFCSESASLLSLTRPSLPPPRNIRETLDLVMGGDLVDGSEDLVDGNELRFLGLTLTEAPVDASATDILADALGAAEIVEALDAAVVADIFVDDLGVVDPVVVADTVVPITLVKWSACNDDRFIGLALAEEAMEVFNVVFTAVVEAGNDTISSEVVVSVDDRFLGVSLADDVRFRLWRNLATSPHPSLNECSSH